MSTQTEHNTPIVPTPSNVLAVDNQNFQERYEDYMSEEFEPRYDKEPEESNRTYYHQGPSANSVGEYMYKICDDSVRPRQFFGTDSEDGIEAILSDRQGHSLHEFIDGDEPLRPIIDFDLPREVFDKIEPKLTSEGIQNSLYNAFTKTCLEIYPKWDKTTITIASSSDSKKLSYHISTFGMHLKNIAKVLSFIELVRKKLPISLQDKKIVDNIANKSSKNRNVFDFMLCPPHDESEVKDNPILGISKEIVKSFDVLYPTPVSPDIFTLRRMTESHCPLCDREHSNDNAYVIRNRKTYHYYCHRADQDVPKGTKKPSLKLVINESVENQERTLPFPQKTEFYEVIRSTVAYIQKKTPIWLLKHKDSENGLYFDIGSKLKLAKFEIKIIDHGGETVKLKTLIDRAVIKGLIVYEDYNFLPYPINAPRPVLDFFNLFLGFWLNRAIQAREFVVMNEMGMASGEWHRFNGHLKSLITERMVAIERDSRIVCFDVSSRCRGEILDHPDAPGVVMSYLLNRDLSNWSPGKIPVTKMKIDTILTQLPTPIRFIIDHISLWPKERIEKIICGNLYQEYVTWCGSNGEKTIFNLINFGKELPLIGIERKQEFSDVPQGEISTNTSTEIKIPIFDIPKIIMPEPEKIKPTPLTTNHIEKDYKHVNDKLEPSPKINEPINDEPETSPGLPINDEPKSTINEASPQQISYPPRYQTREQREAHLRQRAIELGEDPDVFITITDKDKLDSISFKDRMQTDARMCGYAKEVEENPSEYMDMIEDGITSSWLDTDEEWKNTEWKNDILARFLHHPNLTLSKYRPNALYDAFSKADVLDQFLNKYNLSAESNPLQLRTHADELGTMLPDWKARKDVKEALCWRLFKENQIEALVPNNKKKRLTIKERAQYCAKTGDVWDIYLHALDLAEIKNDADKEIVASSSRLSQFRKELTEAGVDLEQINIYAKLPNITQASNKIQKRKLEQGLISRPKMPKHFSLEEGLRRLQNIRTTETPTLQDLADGLRRLQNIRTTETPTLQDLADVIMMLSMRPAKATTLRIIHYEPDESNPLEWYNPDYSWYCTGYIKNKGEAKNNSEPRPFLSMEKNPECARELLTWIQNAIVIGKLRDPVYSINGKRSTGVFSKFLKPYGITAKRLRKIGGKHASRVHGGQNSTSQHLAFLSRIAMRHKMDRHDSGMYYTEGDTSDSDLDSNLEPEPKTLASTPKLINENTSEIEDIYDLYGSI
ncbi:hypothetical protein C2G38_2211653 [Gigaspora rosea]|uniref:Uncharacterized protein n=1 Tax=Gigaspora rosea TaxID=44941 RepID=A0A397UM41_9GLOM|nr:hypothetical protein C2G38_2211653 [Gigaspora rosea]